MTLTPVTADHDTGPTPAEYAASIRSHLAVIRRAWPHLIDPPKAAGNRPQGKPGSRPPTPFDALSLRAEISHDLAFWCQALLEDHPEGFQAFTLVPVPTTDREAAQWIIYVEQIPLDLGNMAAMLDKLHAEAKWIGGWEYASRIEDELSFHARDARSIAWPRSMDGVLLGECPVTIGVEGEPVPCGGRIRATAKHVGDIPCPRCKTKDTIEGWLLRIVGTDRPVSIPQLVSILRGRLGVRVDERTLQRWHKAGRINRSGGTEGKPLFDRRHVMAIVVAYEEAKGGRTA